MTLDTLQTVLVLGTIGCLMYEMIARAFSEAKWRKLRKNGNLEDKKGVYTFTPKEGPK